MRVPDLRPDKHWTFVSTASGVNVTWGMKGDVRGPLGGPMALNMDTWIGANCEDRLSRLKNHVEAIPPKP